MSLKERAKAHNDHNVYILGAGFSREANLPLIKDFMSRMRDASAWLEQQGSRDNEVEAIAQVLQFRLRAAAAAYRVPLDVENVEELFSLASAGGGEDLNRAMTLAIAATLDYARSVAAPVPEALRFNVVKRDIPGWTKPTHWEASPPWLVQQSPQIKGNWYSCLPYDFYVGVLAGYFNKGGPDRRDTIITFNYDTIIEDGLRRLYIPFDYGIPSDSIRWHPSAAWIENGYSHPQVRLLKLHGSLNWAGLSPEQQERLLRRLYEGRASQPNDYAKLSKVSLQKVRGLSIYGDYKALRADRSMSDAPLLLPPTWTKAFGGHLAAVRDSAVEVLKNATRVVILGYSIPPTDQHFRYLLAAGLQDNISLRKVLVVNPGLKDDDSRRELEERLFRIIRPELWAQEIVEMINADTRSFLAGPWQGGGGEDNFRPRMGRSLNLPGHSNETAPWTLCHLYGPGSSIE